MQQLWTLGLNLDDPIPVHIYLQWTKFCDELSTLSELRIPRLIYTQKFKDTQLHGFPNDREVGYACLIYYQIVTDEILFLFT